MTKNCIFVLIFILIFSCSQDESIRYFNDSQRITSGEFATGKLIIDPVTHGIISGSKFGFFYLNPSNGFLDELSFLHSYDFSITTDGSKIFLLNQRGELIVFDKSSNQFNKISEDGIWVNSFDVSPDETKIAFSDREGNLSVLDLITSQKISLGSGSSPLFSENSNQIFSNSPSAIINVLTKSITKVELYESFLNVAWKSDGLHFLVKEIVVDGDFVNVNLIDLNQSTGERSLLWEKQFVNYSNNIDKYIFISSNDNLDKIILAYKGNNWGYVAGSEWYLNVYLVDLNTREEQFLALSHNKEVRSVVFDDLMNKVYFSLGNPENDSATLFASGY
ncbi:hypothetical protein [Marinigracilibium pacificum]|uniref:WD40 repeat protein n=1 Tax=Marinigracilibium pacificum TaxID=2729599 RepID=A0A848IYZ6_9BACT|nr:hypothetical protein [Marinigracilibium pacificum]NMM48571.1 hypothetical protein [Marinigracilibium pacificum]